MTERKASDILLELETKLDLVLKAFQNYDLQNKIMINRLGEILQQRATTAPDIPPPPTASPQIKIEAADMKGEAIRQAQQVQSSRRTSRDAVPEKIAPSKQLPTQSSSPFAEIEAEITEKVKVRRAEQSPVTPTEPAAASLPKIAITQKVIMGNGKSAFLAEVEIFDVKNQVVCKTKANGAGKWRAELVAGNYRVVVRKKSLGEKHPIEVTQNIAVQSKNGELDLDTLTIS